MIVDKNLLPCPHCGSKARIEYAEAIPGLAYRVFAKCTSCGSRSTELSAFIDPDTVSDMTKSFKFLREHPNATEIDPAGDRGLDGLVATFTRTEACVAELWNRRDDTDPHGLGKAIERGIEMATFQEEDDA